MNYSKRLESLIVIIEKNFPKSTFKISKLENDFGPAVLEGKCSSTCCK